MIDSSGSVGIGSTSPAALLDVAGTSRLIGSITTNITGSTQCLHVSSAGVVSGTGSDCGSGGGGSGTVSSGSQYQLAWYPNSGSTTIVAGDANIYSDGSNNLFAPGGKIAIGTTSTPASTLVAYDGNSSATLTNFTQAVTDAGLNIMTNYTVGNYTPGVFWSTNNNNATKPKAGIWTKDTSSGSYLNFGTSNTYSTGITNQAMVIDYNGNVGIGTTSPATNLEVAGALRLSTATTDSILTPVGNSVPTKFNVPVFDPGSYGQIIAMGIPSGAQTTARVMSLFDARTVAHQPTLAVFSPDEANLVGFSWEGSNATSYIKTTGGNLAIRTGATDLMTLLSGGNVGIGTTGPLAELWPKVGDVLKG